MRRDRAWGRGDRRLYLPTLVSSVSFFVGFATIGVTGLIAGLIALLGPAASGLALERISA